MVTDMENKELKPKIRFKGFSNTWQQCKLEEIYKFQYGEFNNNPSNGGIFPVFGANGTQNVNTLSEEEIINLINSLWYAGAEAISINEMRITPQTGIKTAGSSISIGSAGRVDPNSEVVIKAIGDKSKLNVAVNYPGVLDYGALKSYNSDVKQSDDITVTKTTQSLRYEYIKPIQ